MDRPYRREFTPWCDGFSTHVFQVADGVPGRTPLLGPER